MSKGLEFERKVISGNYAVSYGVMLSDVEVISAYPITPQTTIEIGRAHV